jgi:tripartite-type tricarboxylate transporter receptor subunit TctC
MMGCKETNMPRRAALAFAFAFALIPSLAPAQQSWPTRPVTMVVPFAAGGPMDVVGRIMAASLSEQLGQQVIIENVGGGGGMTGAARVAKAAPDGYQFVLGNVGTHAVSQSLFKNPPYRVATDFAPVALVADLSLVLVARKDLPANNLQEFIAYAKANQDKMQFASAGAGSATHLGCALLNATIGVNVTHIPYRGGGPAMQDIVAGRVDYICIDTPGVISLIASGQIKALALLSRARSASLPNVPTAQEQGLANFEAANWAAFFMPKGTPAPIVAKLQAASAAAIDSDAVRQRMKQIGVDPVAPDRRSSEYLAKFVDAEIAKWAGPVKASGLAAE